MPLLAQGLPYLSANVSIRKQTPRGQNMLVLTRKIGDKIRIPDRNVLIKVVEICGDHVRIGINAPDSIRILRGELVQQIDEARTDRGLAVGS